MVGGRGSRVLGGRGLLIGLALTLAAASWALVAPRPARAATLVAGADGFPTIGEAIAAAEPGDTVLVRGGLYRENLIVDKPIHLAGAGRVVIDGGNHGDVIRVTAPGAVLEGLTVTGSGRRLENDPAGIRISADDVVVRRCRLLNNVHGIYVEDASGDRLLDNEITGLAERGLEDRGDAIHLFNAMGGVVSGNRLRDARDGIYLDYARGFTIEGNLGTGLRFGIHSMNSSGNRISRNTLTGNVVGAALMLSHNLTFRANRVVENRDIRSTGILIKDSDGLAVEGNVVAGNTRGVSLDNANRCRVSGNLLAMNGTGLAVAGNSSNNTFSLNSFMGNQQAVEVDPVRTDNVWAEAGRGNYWDSYRGYDFDRDGVGDIPFRSGGLFSDLAASFPELRLLAAGPALTALEWAERAFPVFSRPSVTDPLPLLYPRFPSAGALWPPADTSSLQSGSAGPAPRSAASGIIPRAMAPYALPLLSAVLTLRGVRGGRFLDSRG